MSGNRIAHRYAKSLIEIAQERASLEEIKGDMDIFYDTVKAHDQLRAVLASPVIVGDKKQAILREIFFGRVSGLTFSFFEIMVRKGREQFLFETAREFRAQYNLLAHISTATVITPMPLTEELRAQFRALVIQRKGGQNVELTEKVDPALLGGYILRMGDEQIDDSLQTRLRDLKREFSDNPYIVKY